MLRSAGKVYPLFGVVACFIRLCIVDVFGVVVLVVLLLLAFWVFLVLPLIGVIMLLPFVVMFPLFGAAGV